MIRPYTQLLPDFQTAFIRENDLLLVRFSLSAAQFSRLGAVTALIKGLFVAHSVPEVAFLGQTTGLLTREG